PQAAVEIMTGAVLPPGTDTVVRYEDLIISGPATGPRVATLNPGLALARGQAVHRQGADRRAGDVLLPVGTRLSPAALAVAATIGAATVPGSRRARVAVVGTGDEAIPFAETPLPHQIRRSNGLMLQALMQEAGAEADLFHLPDDADHLRQALPALLTGYDVVVLSGGVSKGRADFLPAVLRELGALEIFHEVAQRPRKPLWFGRYSGGAVVFGLPGNPVSSFVSAVRYVRPWLWAAAGEAAGTPELAVLTEAVTFAPPLTYFLPVRLLSGPDGRLLATPQRDGGSGDLALLLTADGFLELPAHRSTFAPGEGLPVWRVQT
ncbi:MAG: molybdopterin molybdotransferase MoeA, partial [Hymenobacteraceae bacterium]|nr:molybdopterin molybdotransferase MoeA [Hymenobacteraceae bacterium]